MFSSMSRALMRRPQAGRILMRNASTTTEAANAASSGATKAKESASKVTSKASEGLTRVQSSAGSGLSKASQTVTSTLSSIGGRTGQVISFAQSLVPPTVYYARVGLELGKLIAQGRHMHLPDAAHFQQHFQSAMKQLRNPLVTQPAKTASAAASNPESIMSRVRNMDNAQLANAGVVVAEIIGFFTIGEILGRFKFIGYRTSGHATGGEHH